jgi:hypothetical protein
MNFTYNIFTIATCDVDVLFFLWIWKTSYTFWPKSIKNITRKVITVTPLNLIKLELEKSSCPRNFYFIFPFSGQQINIMIINLHSSWITCIIWLARIWSVTNIVWFQILLNISNFPFLQAILYIIIILWFRFSIHIVASLSFWIRNISWIYLWFHANVVS